MAEIEIYNAVLIAIYVFGVVVFPILLFVPAPFGRFGTKGWGPTVNGRIGWAIFETVPLWAMPLSFFLPSDMGVHPPINTLVVILFAMWMGHYIHRGIIYSICAPRIAPHSILIVLTAFPYNVANGYLNGRSLGPLAPAFLRSNPAADVSTAVHDVTSHPQFLLGLGIFLTGMTINIVHDHYIFYLRRQTDAKIKKDGDDPSTLPPSRRYVIPRGLLFDYVSCPAYFGEIVEWLGWAIASNTSGGWCFALYTFCNVFPRGVMAHKWYLETFGDAYPKNRWAVVPYLW